jgi:transcriptional regulator with XRE-family HTH domain
MIAEEMNLAQIREALRRSQAEIAEKCGIKQAAISRLERRTDMRISTLRNLVGAMGGTLQIVIRFSDRRPIRINQFPGSHRSRSKNLHTSAARPSMGPRSELASTPPRPDAPTARKTKKAKPSSGG